MDLPILIFLVITLSFLGGMYFVPRLWLGDRSKLRQRLTEEFDPGHGEKAATPLYKDLDTINLSPGEEYALLQAENPSPSSAAKPGFRKRLEIRLESVDWSLSVEQFLSIPLFSAVVLSALGFWCIRWPGVLVGSLGGLIIPFVILQAKVTARRERFLQQLPNAFELMARVIRAGQSVPQSFQAVAEAFDDPLASEFSRCMHQQNLGLRAEVVLQEMAHRAEIGELHIFAMAMLIQRQTGGNLSEVLDRLAALIRNRVRLRQQVRSLTAEGRLQGITLAILPVVMFAAMYVLNRKYALVLLDHSGLIAITAALMFVGLYWIRSIVNFKV